MEEGKIPKRSRKERRGGEESGRLDRMVSAGVGLGGVESRIQLG